MARTVSARAAAYHATLGGRRVSQGYGVEVRMRAEGLSSFMAEVDDDEQQEFSGFEQEQVLDEAA